MAQFVKTFAQELNNKDRRIHHCENVCFTGDNLSDMIGVYLTVDGQPYTGGGTVSGTVINSRGQTIPITTGAISGNLVTVALEQSALAVPGLIGVYVKLTTGETVTTVLAAKFTVEQTETDTPIDPGTVISSVDTLITRINTAVESIPADYSELLAGVAPSFSSSAAYTAGQYVWYPGLVDDVGALYRFTADHAAGSWTGTDAAAVVLANDVAELKSALSRQDSVIYGSSEVINPTLEYLQLAENATTYVNSSETGYNTKYIPVEKYQKCVFAIKSTRTGEFRFGFANNVPKAGVHAVYLGKISLTGTESGMYEYTPTENGYVSVSYWYDLADELKISKAEGGITKSVAEIPSLISDQAAIAERITEIEPNVHLSANDFDIGNITISTSGWTYSNSSTRVRTKPGTSIHLKKGDVISLSDYSNARYYLGWYTGEEYGSDGWRTSDYTVVADGEYVVLITAIPEATVQTVNDLFGLLAIKNSSSPINDVGEKADAAYILAESQSEDILFMQNDMQSVTGNVKIDDSGFELGNIWFKNTATTPSEWVYEKKTTRIRTKQGVTYSLPAGTKIEITSGPDVTLYIGCISSGTSASVTLNNGATLTTNDGEYAFVLAYYPESAITDVEQLVDRLVITLPTPHQNTGMTNPLLRPAKPNLIAHRGDDTLAPENTIPAFVFAGKAHAWAIETDIHETADGHFVCIHDATVDSTTDGTGNVKDKTLSEIEALTIDSGAHIDDYPNLKVPTLGEYMMVCKRYGAVAFIEIKRVVNYSNLISEIKKYGMVGSTVFIAQNETAAVAVRAISAIPVALLIDYNGNIANAVAIASKYSDIWIDVNKTLCTAENVEMAHSANIPFVTWTIVQSSDVIADLENGADAVTVNGITNIVIDD